MGEQIRVPEGWKVEIRVRKTGRKDRYYVDPANGYIFRSLKDIDRYLLTGKLGRHVTKTKPKDLGSSDLNVDVPLPLKQHVSEEKKFLKPDGMKTKVKPHPDGTKKKSFQAVRGQKLAGNASKIEDGRAQNSNDISEKKSSRSSNRRAPTSSRKKDLAPFFIRDPDQCDEGNAVDIPNLSEIIDSIHKEKEGRNTVYLSAPAIGALLGAQLSETRSKQETLNLCKHCMKPNFPGMAPKFTVKKDDWKSKNIISPYQVPPPTKKRTRTVDTKSKEKEDPGSPTFGDLLTDPCIDFAIKTLTGAIPSGSGQVGSSTPLARTDVQT